MEGNRKLHYPQVGPEVATRFCDVVHQEGANFGGELVEFCLRQTTKVLRGRYRIKNGHKLSLNRFFPAFLPGR